MQTMPAHPDVAEGLRALAEKGYRLVTLTNSPPSPEGTPLENAGLSGHFERQFSVDTWRMYKPSSQLYVNVADELAVPPSECMMVAAHVWDTIGAQAAGYGGALITRPGNAPLSAPGLPEPTLVVADLAELAARL
jgi:2-haloacid dehalogenase